MNSHDYWLAREQNNLKHYEAQEKGYSKKVEAIYQSMIDECTRDIEGFYARYAKKEGITLAEAKKRAANLDIKAYERKAKKYVREKNFSDQANEEMRLYNMTMKVNRLELLKSELSLEMTAGADEIDKYYQQIFFDRAIEEYKRQAGILGLTVPDDEVLEKMADNIVHGSFQNPTIDGSYTTFSERIWVNQDSLRAAVYTELTRGIIKGLNPLELAKSLDKKMQAGRYNAERLMRTELARVQTGAQQQAISEAGYDEYMFIATESGHTCSICRALDGKVFKLKKMQIGTNAPPLHPHCRCSCAAAMSDEEFKELTGVDPVHMDLKAINAEAVAKYKAESNSLGHERGITHKRIEKKDAWRIDRKYIQSNQYKRKFNGITGIKSVDDALHKYSKAALIHRDGTDKEDLFIISANSGDLLGKNTTSNESKGVAPNKSVVQAVSNNVGDTIGLHSHFDDTPPTGSDFEAAFKRRYKFGVVANANGDVYTYGCGDKYVSQRVIDATIEKYKKLLDKEGKPIYSSYKEAHLAALNSLKEEWGIWYEAR
ncbi:MAG: minor capsid protein [Bilifractor sp.]|jgi:SPP1 gp7 family putative phage head morphogenesis protein